jgi:hypothetical protein
MENPYQSPQPLSGELASSAQGGGLAGQIPVVAILLMVQGGLEVLMAGLYLVSGGAVAFVAANQGFDQMKGNPPLSPQAFGWLMVVTYAVLAIAAFAVAALKIFAGWRNYSFRGRIWGMAALVSGMASVVTCYCFPTALLLMIYGLIVYLNPQSAWAFELGDRGQPRDQILWRLHDDKMN